MLKKILCSQILTILALSLTFSQGKISLGGTWTYTLDTDAKKISINGGTINNNSSTTSGRIMFEVVLVKNINALKKGDTGQICFFNQYNPLEPGYYYTINTEGKYIIPYTSNGNYNFALILLEDGAIVDYLVFDKQISINDLQPKPKLKSNNWQLSLYGDRNNLYISGGSIENHSTSTIYDVSYGIYLTTGNYNGEFPNPNTGHLITLKEIGSISRESDRSIFGYCDLVFGLPPTAYYKAYIILFQKEDVVDYAYIGNIAVNNPKPSAPPAPAPNDKRNDSQKKEKSTPSYELVTCSTCHGTGKNPTRDFAPTYGIQQEKKFCDICNSYQNPHWHQTCPSCRGKGKEKKLKY